MFGYQGKALHVDLTAGSTNTKFLKEGFCRRFVGGSGFVAKYLYDFLPQAINPFSPQNMIVFATGSFCVTSIPSSSKYAVGSKSPLTNLIGDSVSSSFWPERLKKSGFDLVAISGRATRPIWILIDEGCVTLENGKDLWGLSTFEATEEIKNKIGDKSVSVAAIGQAGENLVRYACICNDYRQAGRAGIGAVMGSKNLKAIAVRGSKPVEVAEPEKLRELSGEYTKQLRQGEGSKGYREYGTLADVGQMNELGSLPTRNWQESTFDGADKLDWDYISKRWLDRKLPCSHCPLACSRLFSVKEGRYKGSSAVMDYEPTYAFGPNCGVDYYPAIVHALELCDSYGMDAISAGVSVGWAMECFEKGIFDKKDTSGIELRFGNHEAMTGVIELIAERKGIGNLLAEGTKAASEKVGRGSEHFAMQSKGMELPGFEARGLKATGFGYAICTRGGCHVRSGSYDLNLKNTVGRSDTDERIGPLVKETEDFASLIDSLLICRLTRGLWPDFEARFSGLAELYALVTGFEFNSYEMRKAGERITNLKKLFNVREGWKRADDCLPSRMGEPLPDGSMKGARISGAEMDGFLDSYYRARGWNEKTGIPTEKKLSDLGLGE